MRDKIAFGKVCAAEEFFAPSFCPSGYDISAASGTRTFCQRNGFGIAAFGEAFTGQEKTEAAELFHHPFAAFFAGKGGRFVEASF